MRWQAGDRGNIEDRRGMTGGRVASVGAGGLLLLLVLSWATGTDFLSLLNTGGGIPSSSTGTSGNIATSPEEERMVDFVSAVGRDVEGAWQRILQGYQPAPGEQVALFCTTGDTRRQNAQAVPTPGRTNVVLVPFAVGRYVR